MQLWMLKLKRWWVNRKLEKLNQRMVELDDEKRNWTEQAICLVRELVSHSSNREKCFELIRIAESNDPAVIGTAMGPLGDGIWEEFDISYQEWWAAKSLIGEFLRQKLKRN